MFNENDFAPKTTGDLVFGNPKSKLLLDDLIRGSYPFPAFGKCAILLYGTWGTGKTTAAKMIPNLMETAQFDEIANWSFEPCVAGGNGPAMLNRLEQQTVYVSFNESGRHYIVLDEIDNLTATAQLHLKSIMNRKDIVWIMTTNYIAYSAQTGHSVHRKLISDPTANWTAIPAQSDHFGAKRRGVNSLLR